MKELIRVYLTAELIEKVRLAAKESGLTLSTFTSMVLSAFLNKYESTSLERSAYDETCTIRLKGSDASLLKKRAKVYGLSPTAFIRDIVLNQNMKHIVIEPSLGRQIIEAFRDYDMDLQYLIHLYKSDASVNDKKEIIESAITGIADLTKLIIKYHKKLTKSHLALRDDILAKIKEDKRGD